MRLILIGNGFDIALNDKFKFDNFFNYFFRPFNKIRYKRLINFAIRELGYRFSEFKKYNLGEDFLMDILGDSILKLEKFDSFENLFEYIEETTSEAMLTVVNAKGFNITENKINEITNQIINFFKKIMLFYLFKYDSLNIDRFWFPKRKREHIIALIKNMLWKYDICLTTNYTRLLDLFWNDIKQADWDPSGGVIHLHGSWMISEIIDFLSGKDVPVDFSKIAWSDTEIKKKSENGEIKKINYFFDQNKENKKIMLDVFGFSVDKDDHVIKNILKKLIDLKNFADCEVRLKYFYYSEFDLERFNNFIIENNEFIKENKIKVFKESHDNFYGIYGGKIKIR